MSKKRLQGVRVAVLAADGFEQVEVTVPARALRREGADVRIISLRPGRIRGMNFLWRGRRLPVDATVFTARPEDYGALLLPGGFVNPDLLRQSEQAREFVRKMDQLGRPIATLCHGPEVLISAGLVRGRRLTSWPGIADDVRNAGGDWQNDAVVRDGRWVASRSPLDLVPFCAEMIELFAAEAARDLQPLARPTRLVAQLARLATVGVASSAVFGARAALRRSKPRWRAGAVLSALGDISIAAALGGMLLSRYNRRPRRVLGGVLDDLQKASLARSASAVGIPGH
jgi:protease I